MIHLLADKNLYQIEQFIPENVRLSLYNPAHGIPDLDGVDALLVQTVTKLNAHTLLNPPERLKFIGTASSGMDHIDEDYLRSKGIKTVNAKGCNANAVAEYVVTSILLWREEFKVEHNPGKIGVIGVGSAGSAVINLIEKFGWDYAAYDPPREETDPNFKSAALDEILDCDILTFHVPLVIIGEYPTYHWLDEEKLSDQNFKLIINASRGGVVDEKALLKAHRQGNVDQFILDVWENEPAFSDESAQKAFIATPHIAGYSVQAKLTATKMVMTELAKFFRLPYSHRTEDHLSKETNIEIPHSTLYSVLKSIHPILEYDNMLRKLMNSPEKASGFRELRNNFPFRNEYSEMGVNSELPAEFPELQKLGIISR